MRKAPARFFSVAAALVLAAIAIRPQDQPPDAARDLFMGRALKGHPRSDAAGLATLTGTQFETFYKGIRPERSLVLFDCSQTSPWCDRPELPEFSFSGVFKTAAAALDLDETQLRKAWLATGSSDFQAALSPWKGDLTDADPFQPLAIVNRMDSAVASSDSTDPAYPAQWRDAELRFVFGLKPAGDPTKPPPGFTLIFEFRLPPFPEPDFIGYAKAWNAVSQVPGPDYLPQLRAAIQASKYRYSSLIRIRINRNIHDETWSVAEWDLRRSYLPTGVSPLEEQINDKYTAIDTATGVAFRPYLDLWMANPNPGPNVIGLVLPAGSPADIYPKNAEYHSIDGVFLDTPKGFCHPSEQTRNVLAMQQCTWCHSTETGISFMHVANRRANESATLSSFLANVTPVDESTPATFSLPSMADLYYADSDSNTGLTAVKVNYTTYTQDASGKCVQAAPAPNPPTLFFNDLARRALFLAGVELLGEHNAPADKLRNAALLREFHTSMAH